MTKGCLENNFSGKTKKKKIIRGFFIQIQAWSSQEDNMEQSVLSECFYNYNRNKYFLKRNIICLSRECILGYNRKKRRKECCKSAMTEKHAAASLIPCLIFHTFENKMHPGCLENISSYTKRKEKRNLNLKMKICSKLKI